MCTDFKSILRKIKANENITQAQLAAKLGLHPSYLSDMANERVPVTDAVLSSIYENYPYISPERTDSPSLSSPQKSDEIAFDVETKEVPLLPMEAVGGRLDGFAVDGVKITQCEKIKTPLKNAEYAIRVTGQSMQPLYPSGCVLFIAKNKGSWMEWGRVYVLDTENGVVVKQLTPSDEGKDFVRCVSLNAAPEYAPFDIPLSSVFGVYRVLGAFTEL